MVEPVGWVGLRNGVLVSRFASQDIAERALDRGWVDSIAPDDWAARAAARRRQEQADFESLAPYREYLAA
jgi:hypothetical protein